MQPVSPEEFEQLVADALDGLPEDVARAFSNVVVVVEDEHLDEPDLLGLYEGVPLTERDRKRGGIHNSLTRILLKPNHIVGGYAQLAYFFNYIGPIGNNRDEVTMIRRRTTPVEY